MPSIHYVKINTPVTNKWTMASDEDTELHITAEGNKAVSVPRVVAAVKGNITFENIDTQYTDDPETRVVAHSVVTQGEVIVKDLFNNKYEGQGGEPTTNQVAKQIMCDTLRVSDCQYITSIVKNQLHVLTSIELTNLDSLVSTVYNGEEAIDGLCSVELNVANIKIRDCPSLVGTLTLGSKTKTVDLKKVGFTSIVLNNRMTAYSDVMVEDCQDLRSVRFTTTTRRSNFLQTYKAVRCPSLTDHPKVFTTKLLELDTVKFSNVRQRRWQCTAAEGDVILRNFDLHVSSTVIMGTGNTNIGKIIMENVLFRNDNNTSASVSIMSLFDHSFRHTVGQLILRGSEPAEHFTDTPLPGWIDIESLTVSIRYMARFEDVISVIDIVDDGVHNDNVLTFGRIAAIPDTDVKPCKWWITRALGLNEDVGEAVQAKISNGAAESWNTGFHHWIVHMIPRDASVWVNSMCPFLQTVVEFLHLCDNTASFAMVMDHIYNSSVACGDMALSAVFDLTTCMDIADAKATKSGTALVMELARIGKSVYEIEVIRRTAWKLCSNEDYDVVSVFMYMVNKMHKENSCTFSPRLENVVVTAMYSPCARAINRMNMGALKSELQGKNVEDWLKSWEPLQVVDREITSVTTLRINNLKRKWITQDEAGSIDDINVLKNKRFSCVMDDESHQYYRCEVEDMSGVKKTDAACLFGPKSSLPSHVFSLKDFKRHWVNTGRHLITNEVLTADFVTKHLHLVSVKI